jgi:hypothetical protein
MRRKVAIGENKGFKGSKGSNRAAGFACQGTVVGNALVHQVHSAWIEQVGAKV